MLRDFKVNANRLGSSCVLLLGVGAVNGILLRTLAQLGVGTIIVCDMDTYDLKSHWTQPVEPGHDGESKVLVQASAAHRINPHIRIIAIHGFAQDLPLCIARAADLFVLAGDNLELVVHVSQLAMGLGKPLFEAAVMGESLTAHLRRYDLSEPTSVCPACAMSENEWANLKSRLGCSGSQTKLPSNQPTRTSPALCGVAAHMAACEVSKEFTRDAPRLGGEDVTYCLASHQLYRTKLPRSGRCRLAHRAWRTVEITEPPTQTTLRSIVERCTSNGPTSDGPTSDGPVQCKAEIPWMHEVRCPSPSCGDLVPVRRFARLGADLGACHCGERLTASALGQRSVLPASDLEHCLDMPLAKLGLGSGDSIAVSTSGDWTYCFLGGATLSDWLAKHDDGNAGRYSYVGATK